MTINPNKLATPCIFNSIKELSKIEDQLALLTKNQVSVNPYKPVAQKVADKVGIRRFQGEGVDFFKNRTSLIPLRILMRILWKILI